MSSPEPHELVVTPEMAELAGRQGVPLHVGERVRFEVIEGGKEAETAQRLPAWIGSFDGPSDLGRRAKEIVRPVHVPAFTLLPR